MKKNFIAAMMFAVILFGFTAGANAQTKEELRKERRAKARQMEINQIKQMLAQKAFFFEAEQISYADNPNYQNIMLNNTTYGLWVYPSTMNVMLPVMGPSTNVSMTPVLSQPLNYTTRNFSYNVVPSPSGRDWTITIRSMNTWTLTNYKFVIDINSEGLGTLTLSNPYISQVVFSGAIYAQ